MAVVKPRIIVALDYPSAQAALALVDRLGARCDFYKVGSELFTAEGPPLVRALIDRGADVFLDLKFHDIPNTMRGAARSAASLGARLLTVHASGGAEGVRAAVDGAGGRCGVLAVSVLTSLDAAALGAAWGRKGVDVRNEVLRLSDLAAHAGAHGLVCAGSEAKAVRDRHADALRLLIPGIRPSGSTVQDQVRVVTPRMAADAGASYLVVGRAVTREDDPVSVLDRIRAEIG